MIKKILSKGEISELVSDSGQGGWSGEAHFVEYENKKYVLRKAQTLKIAKNYENISIKLGKTKILPTFLGRTGKNVLYEYIEGRDLKVNESLKIIKQIGKISAQINKINSGNFSIKPRFYKQVKEATTGIFKEKKTADRPILTKDKIKPLLTKEKAKRIKKLYLYLNKKIKPPIKLDMNDANPSNFRLRKGKVYFVDIEAIKPRIKAYHIGKAFTKWFKTLKQRKAFLEGYKSVLPIKFLTEYYYDLIYLIYLVQEVNYSCKYGKKYKPRQETRLEFLDELLNKYLEALRG
jgi:hypothetical protein